MHKSIDIARAFKDRAYFDSLSAADQARVRSANPVGEIGISDAQLESVSGGLSGGEHLESTTTSTANTCICTDSSSSHVSRLAPGKSGVRNQADPCTCVC
jgi:mersacidin/lichenicidin family type 2 lantibiotic